LTKILKYDIILKEIENISCKKNIKRDKIEKVENKYLDFFIKI